MRLQTKVSLVTGASRGIGRACTLELARRGADVVIVDRDHFDEAESVAVEVRSMGRIALILRGDVADRQRLEEIFEAAMSRMDRLDILVANAAKGVHRPFLELSDHDFRTTLDVTLLGVFHCGQLAARQMVRQGGGGAIVAISSVHAVMPYRGCVPYNAAKAALNSMVSTMANELAEYRIRVNAVEPGWTDTPSQRTRFSEEYIREQGKRLPFGRLASAEEIAKGVAFLANDDASYITGAVLRIDGGFVLPRLGS